MTTHRPGQILPTKSSLLVIVTALLLHRAAASIGQSTQTTFVDFSSELRSIQCKPEMDFADLKDAHLIHYLDDDRYDLFDGSDLVKHTHPDEVASSDGRPKTILCVGDDTEEGTWHVQRIGPFRSVGGGDWWQFAWLDMFGFDGTLGEEHRVLGQGPAALTGHWSGPVTSDGNPIGLPPLHIHHIHLTSDSGLSWTSNIVDCATSGKNCPDGGVLYAHHGDKQRLDPEKPRTSGFDTFGEDYGMYGKLLHRPISCTGEINDLRPPGSPAIEWWYQSAVRVVKGERAEAKLPLSLHYLFNPFEMGVNTQISRFGTFQVHPKHDSVHFYTGRMPFGGEVVKVESHAHAGVFQQSFLFEGSPKDLGLEVVWPDYTWVPVNAADALSNMGQTPAVEPADGANNDKIITIMKDHLAQGRAQQICHSNVTRVELDGRNWDRAASLKCVPWSFEPGTQYTSMSFHGVPNNPPGQHRKYRAISQITHPFALPPENTFQQHTNWFISYASRDDHSRYTWAIGSQDPDALTPIVSKVDLYRILVYGVPGHAPGFFDTYILVPVLNLALSLLSIFHPTFTWFSPWPLRLSFGLALVLFTFLVAGFFIFVRILRYPKVVVRMNHISPKLTGRTIHAYYPITPYTISPEVLSYSSIVVTLIAILAATITVTGPKDVYLTNTMDQELFKEARPDLQWATGRPEGLSARSMFIGLLLLLVLGAVTYCCLRITQRAVILRNIRSIAIKRALDVVKEDDGEDAPMISYVLV